MKLESKAILLVQFTLMIGFLGSCKSTLENPVPNKISYEINLNEISGAGSFLVKAKANKLSEKNNIYNFVSTVPGLYGALNYGRLVLSFDAFSATGEKIETKQIGENQWQIERIKDLDYIQYEISESFGNWIEDDIPYLAGTDLDSTHVLLNTFGVLGYFENLEESPIELDLNYPSHWTVGTALDKNSDGLYLADSYEQLADSPILMGELETASLLVGNITVDVYTFSSNDMISAQDVMSRIEPALNATSELLTYSPVNRYTVLMEFLDSETRAHNKISGIGALEHRNSSAYVLSENPRILSILNEWVAHEFFHIAVPLNLHSDAIRPFNFKQVNPDRHLWLYEGVTVWASEIMFLRSGRSSLEAYLGTVASKIDQSPQFSIQKSLADLSSSIYEGNNSNPFGFIDNNGSLAVMCVDILILELSKGDFGFREVLVQLMKDYGANKPFPEDGLFEIIESRTFPEVGEFFTNYIQGNAKLSYNDYLNKIGLRYDSTAAGSSIEQVPNINPAQQILLEKWTNNF